MKWKMNNKIRAFTVLELLMVMMLSGIVVGLTFLYFTQFRHYLQSIYQQESAYSQLHRFQFALQKDIALAKEIYAPSEDEIRIVFANDEVEYLFDSDWIVRETEMATDTIPLRIVDVSLNVLTEYNKLIGDIELELEAEPERRIQLSFTKEYCSATLFRNFKKQN